MRDILIRINKTPGVHGTLVVGDDGLVIASDVADGKDPQALAAVASNVAATLTLALERMGQGQVSRFLMNGTEGCAVLQTVQKAILLTLVKRDANMGMVLVELQEAAEALAAKLAGPE